MNNACPTCGAVYAVTTKDIGRKLKCKKCSTALAVTDAGLVVDGSAAGHPGRPVACRRLRHRRRRSREHRGRRRRSYSGRRGPGLGETLAKIGGIPTILFGFGTFLVLWFTFMDPIGQAAIDRAQMAEVARFDYEQQAELKKLLPKGKKSPLELEGDERKTYDEKAKKINEDYEKRAEDAKEKPPAPPSTTLRSMLVRQVRPAVRLHLPRLRLHRLPADRATAGHEDRRGRRLGLMLLMIFSLG